MESDQYWHNLRLPVPGYELELRPMLHTDAESIAQNINYPQVARTTLLIPYPYVLDDARAFLSSGVVDFWQRETTTKCFLGIAHPEQGIVGIIESRITGREGELGYWLTPDWWGQGVMTAVIGVFCNFLTKQFGINQFAAKVFTINPASRRALEKNGFTLAETQPERFRKNDQLIDAWLLKKEL